MKCRLHAFGRCYIRADADSFSATFFNFGNQWFKVLRITSKEYDWVAEGNISLLRAMKRYRLRQSDE